jgi:hypothetical protein
MQQPFVSHPAHRSRGAAIALTTKVVRRLLRVLQLSGHGHFIEKPAPITALVEAIEELLNDPSTPSSIASDSVTRAALQV